MKNFIENLEDKIRKNIQLSKIEILDNTHKHKKHKTFQKDKFHITLIIDSEELRLLNKVEAHKKIMKILSNELRTQIHALEIKIK
tara:strand:- start:164 stop:418 length:255 start_codon:yes stop_codon:yes gene_type:complete